MTQPPILTDRTALARHRARARALPGHDDALFLHRLALDDLQERLSEVNKRFTSPAVVTAYPQIFTGFPTSAMVPDADLIALEPGAHDLVVHFMALHWANDPVGQLVQCRRALQPDGLCLVVLPGGRSLQELRACLAEAEAAVTGGLSPRVVPMGEIRDLGGLMQRAGFALPVADSLVQTVQYRSFPGLLSDLRAAGETNALAGRLRRFTRRAVLAEAGRIYAGSYGTSEGRLAATAELVVLTGWVPHESQQQPLRPGSARSRLADALGVPEKPLKDG
ncbi:methyltransferase domain-containing protein [Tabrizicola sp.]|uniref:methyltransferase domain-containing protein n=1 Tax=Tabrizicola sp. TaxID=2005166 RepID=UPI002736B177|nr:methyltransferase domain-containing protein [Tabrizicola sp.]MDP3197455.1 methyltransferase domain-containing protein [Tabrizicola sp.]